MDGLRLAKLGDIVSQVDIVITCTGKLRNTINKTIHNYARKISLKDTTIFSACHELIYSGKMYNQLIL